MNVSWHVNSMFVFDMKLYHFLGEKRVILQIERRVKLRVTAASFLCDNEAQRNDAQKRRAGYGVSLMAALE